MLKTRIIPVVLLNDYNVVKSIQFRVFRNLGSPITVCRIYDSRGVDELVLLDIKATLNKQDPRIDIVADVTSECFMPLSIGGGIKTIAHARAMLANGADKVAINSEAVRSPEFITALAAEFGAQCVMVSIDVKKDANGRKTVHTHAGTRATELDPVAWAVEAEERGAGEILLTSIDLDGTMKGYDLELIKAVCQAVSIPVIASGGAGNYEDMYQALTQAKASAVAAASIYHFTEQTPLGAKHYLHERGIPVRL
jgi:cyclase